MRAVMLTTGFSFICFAMIAGLSQYANNATNLRSSANIIRHWATSLPIPSEKEYHAVETEVLHQAIVYDYFLRKESLLDGMVVSTTLSGRALHECDSLLFSSLRFVSLKKLGFHAEAAKAWTYITKSQAEGHWRRHPRCWEKSTSRDMIIGVIAALTQKPDHHQTHIKNLFSQITRTGGFVSDGPIYVSYLTPSIARLLQRLARAHGFSYKEMPDIVRRGYSTNEWAVPVLENGYRTHLAALAMWVDLELAEQGGAPLSAHDRLAIEWTTYKLISEDPENLFFRYLRLRATSALTPAVKFRLLKELASHPAFPAHTLPTNCDRRADYLWQRDSREYEPRTTICTRQYSGVDFLWMAALLLDSPEKRALAH